MGYYYKNRLLAQTKTTDPTLTDQSQAINTDINIIVRRIQQTGMAPGAPIPAFYADLTGMPRDLRGFLELGKTIEAKRRTLPETLRHMPLEQLITLNKDQLTAILKPADTAPKQEPTK